MCVCVCPLCTQDAADEVLLSEGLGSKLLSIPGMDNYFMYQLEYKRVSGCCWGSRGWGGKAVHDCAQWGGIALLADASLEKLRIWGGGGILAWTTTSCTNWSIRV
jgi:hypothetical protein